MNLCIGTALMLLMQTAPVQDNTVVVNARNAIVDWQMARLAAVHTESPSFLIDIDEQAAETWPIQEITPRDKLAKLIAYAVKGNPAAIVVDIGLLERSNARADGALLRYIAAYNAGKACAGRCPPLILARKTEKAPRFFYSGRKNVSARRALPAIVDNVLHTTPENPWNFAGNVRFGTIETDGGGARTGSWRLWETICSDTGSSTAIPSAALLAVAGNDRASLERVRGAIAPMARSCVTADPGRNVAITERTLNLPRLGREIDLTEDPFERRFFLRFGWATNDEAARAPAIPATAIISGRAQDPKPLLDGKIAFIGDTFGNADMHQTALGRMPGVVVLMNEVNSLIAGDSLREPSPFVHYAVEIAFIVLLCALLFLLDSVWAIAATAGAIVLFSLTAGLAAFNAGIFVDALIPIAGIFAHEAFHRVYHRITHLSAPHAGKANAS